METEVKMLHVEVDEMLVDGFEAAIGAIYAMDEINENALGSLETDEEEAAYRSYRANLMSAASTLEWLLEQAKAVTPIQVLSNLNNLRRLKQMNKEKTKRLACILLVALSLATANIACSDDIDRNNLTVPNVEVPLPDRYGNNP